MTTLQATLITPDTIRTASLYPLATLEARTAGTARVLVTRYWPRGVAGARIDEWCRPLAPEATLLHAYKTGVLDWESFADEYRAQVAPVMFVFWLMYFQDLVTSYGAITLLCVEHCPRDGHDESDVRCHRRLLRELLLTTSQPAC